jgi:hypothetical protein
MGRLITALPIRIFARVSQLCCCVDAAAAPQPKTTTARPR